MRVTVRRSLLAAAALCAGSVACTAHTSTPVGTSSSTLLAQDGSDANEVESQSSSLAASFTLASGSVTTGTTTWADQMIKNASKATSFFVPANCLVVAPDAPNMRVTYTFTACSGPWGIVNVTGTIVAHYATDVAGTLLQIDVGGAAAGTPASLEMNRATATYQATATVSKDSTEPLLRNMTWTAAIDGTTARGRTFSRNATRHMQWKLGDSTVILSGQTNGTIANREVDTTVTNYVKSRGECPASGEVKIVESSKGAIVDTIDIAYDGSSVASFTDNGRTNELTLACGL